MAIRQLLKRFPDNTWLAYDEGRFDSWRVSFWREGQYLWSPSDFEVFVKLSVMAKKHKWWKVWTAIRNTAGQINRRTEFREVGIELLSNDIEENKTLSVLTATMIAEENKSGTMLGKSIKLIGCYQVLVRNWLPIKAADWSRGKPWRRIKEEYGFLMMI